jgi:amino acid transporter
MKNKAIQWVFWAMVAFFIISIASILILVPILGENDGDSPLRLSGFAALPVFCCLGVALLVLTIKKQEPGLLKKLLLLSGASAAGLFVFVLLHNGLTALLISAFHFAEDFDEPVFFILATIVCPLGFLVGAIGTIVLTIKNRPKSVAAIS